jgi:hypothetical protein
VLAFDGVPLVNRWAISLSFLCGKGPRAPGAVRAQFVGVAVSRGVGGYEPLPFAAVEVNMAGAYLARRGAAVETLTDDMAGKTRCSGRWEQPAIFIALATASRTEAI